MVNPTQARFLPLDPTVDGPMPHGSEFCLRHVPALMPNMKGGVQSKAIRAIDWRLITVDSADGDAFNNGKTAQPSEPPTPDRGGQAKAPPR
jgi:hypothetical protein